MRINRIVAGAMASVLALGAVAPAFADDYRDRQDRREWRDDRQWREDRREWRHDRREWERDRRQARRDWRHDPRPYYRPGPPPPPLAFRPAPPPPRYGWRVGYPYRNYYSGPVYVVNDYPRYQLRRPPYGHQWIRDDRGNMLLVAVATGIIADYIINNR